MSGQQKGGSEFNPAQIYPSVVCQSDTALTYALCLPPGYEKGKPCPLLILFDSHGDGLLPVKLFSSEANKSGFIVAGSNNSKNGMPVEQTTAIYKSMISDITGRFDIEKKAVYVGGFSGGSRVAAAAAITVGEVSGILGCGAGLPNIAQNPVTSFSYLAVVGTNDFNYAEMVQLDKSLEQAGYTHHMLIFDGIHQWPPKEIIPDIFTWLRFDAMRQGAIPTERKEINAFIENNDKLAGKYAEEGNTVAQLQVYSKLLHYLQGLTDVTPLKAEIDRLSATREVVAYHEKQDKLISMEEELRQKYTPEIEKQSIEWWKDETDRLRNVTEKSGDPDQKAVYKRVLGSLSLTCYMYSNAALKQGDLIAAARFIEIYRLVDPTNAEHRYMAAQVAALSNKPDAMYEALQQAFSLGFNDLKRLKTDKDFSPYVEDERFKSFLSRE